MQHTSPDNNGDGSNNGSDRSGSDSDSDDAAAADTSSLSSSTSSFSSSSSLPFLSDDDDDDDDDGSDLAITFNDKAVVFDTDKNVYYEPREDDRGDRAGSWTGDRARFDEKVSRLAKAMDPIINDRKNAMFRQNVLEKNFTDLNRSVFASTVPGFNADDFFVSSNENETKTKAKAKNDDDDDAVFRPMADLSVYERVASRVTADEGAAEAFAEHLYRRLRVPRREESETAAIVRSVAALFQITQTDGRELGTPTTEEQRRSCARCIRHLWQTIRDNCAFASEFGFGRDGFGGGPAAAAAAAAADDDDDGAPPQLTSFWLSFVAVFCDPLGRVFDSALEMYMTNGERNEKEEEEETTTTTTTATTTTRPSSDRPSD
uniref:Uncharacterized protein n=1 Tax=Panulirus argus virus 1 TaxID=380624 RepID=A0A6G9HF09_9VIRU|nr:hypothetical protein [Panulirus argus virus 1]